MQAELRFIGFDSSSLEKVVFKKYSIGSGFNNPIKSATIYLSKSKSRLGYYDTVNKLVYYDGNRELWPGEPYLLMQINTDYEYEIEVPNAGKDFRISSFACSDAKSACSTSGASGCLCTNPLESYELNGQVVFTGISGPVYCTECRAELKLQR